MHCGAECKSNATNRTSGRHQRVVKVTESPSHPGGWGSERLGEARERHPAELDPGFGFSGQTGGRLGPAIDHQTNDGRRLVGDPHEPDAPQLEPARDGGHGTDHETPVARLDRDPVVADEPGQAPGPPGIVHEVAGQGGFAAARGAADEDARLAEEHAGRVDALGHRLS